MKFCLILFVIGTSIGITDSLPCNRPPCPDPEPRDPTPRPVTPNPGTVTNEYTISPANLRKFIRLIENFFGKDILKLLKLPDFSFKGKPLFVTYTVSITNNKITKIDFPTISIRVVGSTVYIYIKKLGVRAEGRWRVKGGLIDRRGSYKASASGISVTLYYYVKTKKFRCYDKIDKFSVDKITGKGILARLLKLRSIRERMAKKAKKRLDDTICTNLNKLAAKYKNQIQSYIDLIKP